MYRQQANDSRKPCSTSWENNENFTPINLPNENKITKIMTNAAHTFYYDDHGNWYCGGPNISHDLVGLKDYSLTLQPKPFDFEKVMNISNDLLQQPETNRRVSP